MKLVRNYKFEVDKYYMLYCGSSRAISSIWMYRYDGGDNSSLTFVSSDISLIKLIVMSCRFVYADEVCNDQSINYSFDKKNSIFYELDEDEAVLLISEVI